jgi:uncharacterized protein
LTLLGLAGLDARLLFELLLLGTATGFLAGLLGVGGGMLMVPAVSFILAHRGVETGLAVKMAIATSMATIAFTSLSSLRSHHRQGQVRWDIVYRLGPGIALGGLAAGAGAFALLGGQTLALLFGCFAVFSACNLAFGRGPKPGRVLPGPWPQALVGAGIGFSSGLLGAGGAFLSVPFMLWCNVPVRQAVGTSAAIGFPVAVAATTGFVVAGWSREPALPGAWGYLFLPALALLAASSMLAAPWGAHWARRVPARRLKRLFAVLQLGIAATMINKALSA